MLLRLVCYVVVKSGCQRDHITGLRYKSSPFSHFLCCVNFQINWRLTLGGIFYKWKNPTKAKKQSGALDYGVYGLDESRWTRWKDTTPDGQNYYSWGIPPQMDAAKLKRNILKLQTLVTDKECLYRDAKQRIKVVALELNKTLEEFSSAKLSVDKFNGSKNVAEKMLNAQLHGRYKGGLDDNGVSSIPTTDFGGYWVVDEIKDHTPHSLKIFVPPKGPSPSPRAIIRIMKNPKAPTSIPNNLNRIVDKPNLLLHLLLFLSFYVVQTIPSSIDPFL
ncbi:hypothetical protein QVD17_30978 [Tagetes erecta]|uniref:Uncharacterized protein n=1 Tax=Tagetes erecta TaxID=13708 RepID=A0AAD8K2I5_TARER|nr:hypothetical protein QVD17_30978 [Tagetes erecta]